MSSSYANTVASVMPPSEPPFPAQVQLPAMDTPAAQQAAVPSSAKTTDAAQQQGISWSADLALYLRAHPTPDAAAGSRRAAHMEAVLRQPEAPGAWLAFLQGEVRQSDIASERKACPAWRPLCKLMSAMPAASLASHVFAAYVPVEKNLSGTCKTDDVPTTDMCCESAGGVNKC